MSEEIHKHIYDEFRKYYSEVSKNAVGYRPHTNNSIVIIFKDGREQRYTSHQQTLNYSTIRKQDETEVEYGARKFVNNLRFYMLDQGFVEDTLAEQCGVSQKTMNNYILRKTFPSLDVLIKMADAFGCTIHDLLG